MLLFCFHSIFDFHCSGKLASPVRVPLITLVEVLGAISIGVALAVGEIGIRVSERGFKVPVFIFWGCSVWV